MHRQQQHVLAARPAAAASRAAAGRAARSKGRRASSAASRSRLGLALGRRQIAPGPSTAGRERRRLGAMTCDGPPVRPSRTWCAAPRGGGRSRRSARSQRRRRRAGPRAGPRRACCRRLARLELVEEPQPLLGERQRAARRRAAPARIDRRPAARPSPAPPRSARPAPATVGASKSARSGSSTPRALAQPRERPGWRAASGRRARRSCRARRPARGPAPRPRSRPPASSIGVRGGDVDGPRRRAAAVGRGQGLAVDLAVGRQRQRVERARRPTGTMYSGSAPLRKRAQLAARRAPGRRGDHVGDQAPARRVASSRATTTASRTAGCRRSAASISPSSMRKPRTFTWWSTRPRNSRSPSAQPAGEVAGAVQPRAGPAAERVGHEPLGGQVRAGRGSRGPAPAPPM